MCISSTLTVIFIAIEKDTNQRIHYSYSFTDRIPHPHYLSLIAFLFRRETLQELLLLRTLARSQSRLGIDLLRLNRGEEKKRAKGKGKGKGKKRKAGDFGENGEQGGEEGGLGSGDDEDGEGEDGDGYGLQGEKGGKGKKSGREAMEDEGDE